MKVAKEYDQRCSQMRLAYDHYIATHGGPHNRGEFGKPREEIGRTTDKSWRRAWASEIRTSLVALAERSLDLEIATDVEYDQYLASLKINW